IGSSNSNDIIVEGDEVALRHAKIYKVGASWKIQNLLIQETTTVNGRRIDQRFLQDGDEVTVGDSTFKFKSGKAQIKQTLKSKTETAKKI
ncbi:MAG: FHA domain-containing protein, partial [SAR324 cluster bacterium]|nr:FHA domain-containing protein [SAR324 cluster bacterium]